MSATSESSAVSSSRVVEHPGHGESFTEHMISIDWTEGRGWSEARMTPLQELSVHPGMIGLHYGQVAYEGLKAHRRTDGSMGVWRPRDHALRFQRSCRRLAMPELPVETFVAAVDQLVLADESSLSGDPSHSIYLRPIMFGTDTSLMLRRSRNYRFLLMAFVAGGFFGDGIESVSVYASHTYSRAFPGGTGDVKIAGNYAPSFLAQREAEAAGCQQVLWLDAVERRYLEEMGGMNIFLVRGHGPQAQVVTPRLTGTLLPGITRDTILTLAERLGHQPVEERISLEQWRTECERGVMSEAFACGTAAVVTPVCTVVDRGTTWTIGDGKPGPVTLALRTALTDLHHGSAPDPDGWLHSPAGR
ncbi:branched-chain amino acid aminotransferase [Streptomyces sp. DSM 41014]|uniref:Branched-chain-amino-acid aminotransferase n=1 Tax=Streptomyces hintoniae TaxID=3075521 RepID=A0ABU2UWV6_9ACTN|nr:branched-chain amino acid aminotransferase [Streptomyces sp. DSM 41014]MDT0477787.1 branched-chain amino acid aminotransferase [Streptomyces sp. DSM 41014]